MSNVSLVDLHVKPITSDKCEVRVEFTHSGVDYDDLTSAHIYYSNTSNESIEVDESGNEIHEKVLTYENFDRNSAVIDIDYDHSDDSKNNYKFEIVLVKDDGTLIESDGKTTTLVVLMEAPVISIASETQNAFTIKVDTTNCDSSDISGFLITTGGPTWITIPSTSAEYRLHDFSANNPDPALNAYVLDTSFIPISEFTNNTTDVTIKGGKHNSEAHLYYIRVCDVNATSEENGISGGQFEREVFNREDFTGDHGRSRFYIDVSVKAVESDGSTTLLSESSNTLKCTGKDTISEYREVHTFVGKAGIAYKHDGNEDPGDIGLYAPTFNNNMDNDYSVQQLKNHFFRFKLFAERPNEMLDEDNYDALIFITQQDMSSHMGGIHNYLTNIPNGNGGTGCDPSGENLAEELSSNGWHEITGHKTKELESGLQIDHTSFGGVVPADLSFNKETYIIIQSREPHNQDDASDVYTHLVNMTEIIKTEIYAPPPNVQVVFDAHSTSNHQNSSKIHFDLEITGTSADTLKNYLNAAPSELEGVGFQLIQAKEDLNNTVTLDTPQTAIYDLNNFSFDSTTLANDNNVTLYEDQGNNMLQSTNPLTWDQGMNITLKSMLVTKHFPANADLDGSLTVSSLEGGSQIISDTPDAIEILHSYQVHDTSAERNTSHERPNGRGGKIRFELEPLNGGDWAIWENGQHHHGGSSTDISFVVEISGVYLKSLGHSNNSSEDYYEVIKGVWDDVSGLYYIEIDAPYNHIEYDYRVAAMNDHYYLNLGNAQNASGVANTNSIDNVADQVSDLSWSSDVSLTTGSIPTFKHLAGEAEEDISLAYTRISATEGDNQVHYVYLSVEENDTDVPMDASFNYSVDRPVLINHRRGGDISDILVVWYDHKKTLAQHEADLSADFLDHVSHERFSITNNNIEKTVHDISVNIGVDDFSGSLFVALVNDYSENYQNTELNWIKVHDASGAAVCYTRHQVQAPTLAIDSQHTTSSSTQLTITNPTNYGGDADVDDTSATDGDESKYELYICVSETNNSANKAEFWFGDADVSNSHQDQHGSSNVIFVKETTHFDDRFGEANVIDVNGLKSHRQYTVETHLVNIDDRRAPHSADLSGIDSTTTFWTDVLPSDNSGSFLPVLGFSGVVLKDDNAHEISGVKISWVVQEPENDQSSGGAPGEVNNIDQNSRVFAYYITAMLENSDHHNFNYKNGILNSDRNIVYSTILTQPTGASGEVFDVTFDINNHFGAKMFVEDDFSDNQANVSAASAADISMLETFWDARFGTNSHIIAGHLNPTHISSENNSEETTYSHPVVGQNIRYTLHTVWIDQNGDLTDGSANDPIANSIKVETLMPVDKPILVSATKVDVDSSDNYDLSLNIHLGGLPLEDLVMVKTGNNVYYEVKGRTDLDALFNEGQEGRVMVDNVIIDASGIEHEGEDDSDFILVLKNSVGMNAYHLDGVDDASDNHIVNHTHLNGYDA